MNKALAINCAAKFDDKKGAEAKNWKEGKPVRVVRNCKGRKHSKYCPEEGNRYDGIYKIVKYWPEKGKSGFKVWRYLLRRDDENPAPWTKKGQKMSESLGLVMQYPKGYLDSVAERDKSLEREAGPSKPKKRKKSDEENYEVPRKKPKSFKYELSRDVDKLISEDAFNVKLWDECKKFLRDGKVKFLKEVESRFLCICCQEVAAQPITTTCHHNLCKPCLQRSFKAEVYTCPTCRFSLGKKYPLVTNVILSKVLCLLFPGYDAGR